MSDTATRAAEALDELRAQLAHADQLITEQQHYIEDLECQITHLFKELDTLKGAA